MGLVLGGVGSVWAAEPLVLFFPADGSVSSVRSANITVYFSGGIYADSAGTAFTSDSVGSLVEVRKGNSAGEVIGADVLMAGTAVVVNPDDDLPEGMVWVGLSDGWWYGDGGSYVRGSARSASFMVDTVAPSVEFPVMRSSGVYNWLGLLTDGVYDGFAKRDDTITTTVDFSKEMDESGTSILYRVGDTGSGTAFSFVSGVGGADSIGSGECGETDEANDVYTCKYVVGAGENGNFGVRVASLTDMVGNSGDAHGRFYSSVTIDTAPPVVTTSTTSTLTSFSYRGVDDQVGDTPYTLTETPAASVTFLTDTHELTDGDVGYFNGDTSVSNTVTANRPDDRAAGTVGRFGNYLIAQSGISSASNSYKPTFFYKQYTGGGSDGAGGSWGEWEAFGNDEAGADSSAFPAYFKTEENTTPLLAGRGGSFRRIGGGKGGAIINFFTTDAPAYQYRESGEVIDANNTIRYLATHDNGTITAYQLFGTDSGTALAARKWVRTMGKETYWRAITVPPGETDCGAANFALGAEFSPIAYTEGTDLTITSPSRNGYRYCFEVTDRAGNIGYGLTDPAAGITNELTITMTIEPDGVSPSKVVNAQVSPTDTLARFKFLPAAAACNADTYALSSDPEETLPLVNGLGNTVLISEEANGRAFCFKLSRDGFSTRYVKSETITGIDTDAVEPTVSSLVFKNGTETAYITSANIGDEVRAEITFSEAVKWETGSTADARPSLFYQTKKNGTTVLSERQFAVADSGSPASGKCTRRSATQYICSLIITSEFGAGAELKVYPKQFVSQSSDVRGLPRDFSDTSQKITINTPSSPLTITAVPKDGGHTTATAADITVSFGGVTGLYANADGAALTNDNVDTHFSIKQGDSFLSFDATVNNTNHTVTLNPNASLPSGRIIVGVLNTLYYTIAADSTRRAIPADTYIIFTADTHTSASAINPVSGGYVNAIEDDSPVTVSTSYGRDLQKVRFTLSDSDTQTADITKDGFIAAEFSHILSEERIVSAFISRTNFGSSVSVDDSSGGSVVAVGVPKGYNDLGTVQSGKVYVFTDANNDTVYESYEVINGAGGIRLHAARRRAIRHIRRAARRSARHRRAGH